MMTLVRDRKTWSDLIRKAASRDFYFTYDYHAVNNMDCEEFILFHYAQSDGNGVLLPLLIRDIADTPYRDATSVYGYAGPLWIGDAGAIDRDRFQAELCACFTELRVISVFSRLHPYLNAQTGLLECLGTIETLGKVVNIDLTLSPEAQWSAISRRFRGYLRKAEQYYRIREGKSASDLEVFRDLYEQTMKRLGAKPHYFFPASYFTGLFASTEFETTLLMAEDPQTGKTISAALFIGCDKMMQYHLSGTDREFMHLHPVKALIDVKRNQATRMGFTHFNLGGGLGSEEDSLFEFKSRFSKDFRNFRVWKYIHNPGVYGDLTLGRLQQDCPREMGTCKKFFPCYRCSRIKSL